MAKGETRVLFIRDAQMFCLRVPIMIAGLMVYGLPGVILGRVFTGLFSTLVNMMLVRRFTGISVLKQLSVNLRALVSVAVMAAGVSLASSHQAFTDDKLVLVTHLATLILVGGLIYCGSTFLLWMLMKRPAGPETEVRPILGKVLPRLRLA
jgi:hypothetical protein